MVSTDRVTVVTDSTAYLPDGFPQRYGIAVIALSVSVADRSAREGEGFGPVELAAALREHRDVTTSLPAPAELLATYRAALDSGSTAVVSVHLSRELSGTWDAARMAAAQVNAERGDTVVRVVDSRSTAMGLGFAALAAAVAAEQQHSAERVELAAAGVAARSKTFFSLQTMEYLRRGGRIGAAAALLGTALAVKPLLHVRDGRIVALEKVRTTGRASARLVDLAVEAAGTGKVALAVHHLGSPELAADLATRLEERIPGSEGCLVSEVGAVIGAHTGPGVLGVVVLPGGWKAAAG
ncbi:MAG: DegV family protein [Sciscionella sp.]